MASVRLTEELRARIFDNASKLFSKDHKIAKDSLSPTFGDRVYQYIYKDVITAMAVLPNNFFQTDTGIRIRFNIKTYQNGTFVLSLTGEKRFPYAASSYRPTPLYDVVKDKALCTEMLEWLNRVEAVNIREKNFLQEVKKALDPCNSLKQLLEAWPNASQLIPDYAMEKLHAKTVKREPKKFVAPEVSKELNTIMLKQRIKE